MFDITSSKLFLLAIVALLVIGPKDFPVLLRTIGKYVGIIRGHAREFRAQFDEAMRESELSQLKQDMEKMARETEASLSATGQSVEQTFDEARRSVEETVTTNNPLAPATDSTPAADSPAAAAPAADPAPQTADAVATDAPAEPPPAPEPPPAAAPEPATADVVAAPVPAVEPAPAAQPAVERTGA
jgi:sec-independent protein translocase protein TatB